MFLSLLYINIGSSPGRLWLRNLYHVHQRLCMAFPSASRKSDDVDFLKPFKPEDFGDQVHVTRGADAGFLFRIDPQSGGRVAILVQSAIEPDWDYAFHNADYLLAAPWQVKPFDPRFAKGQRLRFRLAANPTKRFTRNSLEENGEPVNEKWVGKRVPVRPDKLHDWLSRRAGKSGFSIDKDSTTIQPGYVYVNKKRNGNGQRLRSVRYDGTLTVKDPDCFQETVAHGIGPGKAFGFGLLSVVPVPTLAPGEKT